MTLVKINLSRASNANGNIQCGLRIMWSRIGARPLASSQDELFILGPGKLPK